MILVKMVLFKVLPENSFPSGNVPRARIPPCLSSLFVTSPINGGENNEVTPKLVGLIRLGGPDATRTSMPSR